MKIYDISQEVFGCDVYPGDEVPSKREEMRMSRGDLNNLTAFSMCAHNGTHIDAPFHFLEDGDTVEQIPLEKLVGDCYVSEQNEDIDAEQARQVDHPYGDQYRRRPGRRTVRLDRPGLPVRAE